MALQPNSHSPPITSSRSPDFFHPFYRPLIDLRIPIIALDPATKRPAFGRVKHSIIANADEACDLLERGSNLGMVCHLKDLPGSNPHGIEVLDIDSPDHGLDLAPFTGPMTRRQGRLSECPGRQCGDRSCRGQNARATNRAVNGGRPTLSHRN